MDYIISDPNLIHSDETTVVVLTGSGLKSSDFFTENFELQW